MYEDSYSFILSKNARSSHPVLGTDGSRDSPNGDLSRDRDTWRPIDGSRGQYEVSSLGKVRNVRTNRLLTPYISPKGEVMIHLRGYLNRNFTLASLIARAFLGEGRVKHIDGNPQNNDLSNLEVI